MTRAPETLMTVRRLLLAHLDDSPGSDDLEAAEVGIVGDPAHRGGYHCGADRVVTNDYSVTESTRDRAGLSDYASALDVGQFSVQSGGRTHDLRSFSAWCVQQCAADAADTRDIREIIYSPDGRTVRRWDRLGKRSTGDSSHRWHTHFSFFRDSTKAGRDQTPLFRRYLTSIGLIRPTPPEVPEMQLTDRIRRDTGNPGRTVDDVLADLSNLRNWLLSPPGTKVPGVSPAAGSPLAVMVAAAGRTADVDEQAVAAELLRVLTPAAIAAAIPQALAAQVADELGARIAGQQG
ncbi:hypothetical protein ACH4T9_31115 [Micromonospora sp. NPDC020750]|uniref:hypothetical protein n=1 Tax=unclassified Micromonospora TaxID=2617518 RepID=UPI0037B473E3